MAWTSHKKSVAIAILIITFLISSAISCSAAEEQADIKIKMAAAAIMLRSSAPYDTWQNAQPINAARLTRNKDSYEGKIVRLKGIVWQIEQLPPIESIKDDWYQMQIMVDNPNSTLGVTSIYFIYIGDASNVEPKTEITCAGYYVGTQQGENAFGGPVEALTIVGNAIKAKGAVSGLEQNPMESPATVNANNIPNSKLGSLKSTPKYPSAKRATASNSHPKKLHKKPKTTAAANSERPSATQIIRRLKNNQ